MAKEIRATLKELQKTYQPFSELWSEWIKSNYCKLSTAEIQLIEFHISNDFKINLNFLLTYYAKQEEIKSVIPKLTAAYPKYCFWVYATFSFSILILSFNEYSGLDDATKLHRGQIIEELKMVLRKFGKTSIDEIFEPGSSEDYSTGNGLELATGVLKFLFERSLITNLLKKPIPTMTEAR